MKTFVHILMIVVVCFIFSTDFCTASSSSSSPPTLRPLFPFEESYLPSSPKEVISVNEGPLQIHKEGCKAFPGDPIWPDEGTWRGLNDTLAGALLKPRPKAAVCYGGVDGVGGVGGVGEYDEGECERVRGVWEGGFERADHPIEVNSLLFEGATCLPPPLNRNGTSSSKGQNCTQGGYPVYVVNITSVAQIQRAVDFARRYRVRLVVKNTSHDFSGRNLGAGGLGVWVHHLKDIEFFEDYKIEGYSGPAFHVGAGVQAREIYEVAYALGVVVVGGVCDSVGLYGGYSLGGGHSMLSSLHGLGADQVLSLNIVLASGEFVTASPTQNEDLFWAVRGGGGSTFGVVTSMIVKAFPDMRTTVAFFSWSMEDVNITAEIFWAGIKSYFSRFEEFTNQGTAAEWDIWPKGDISGMNPNGKPAFQISQFFALGKTLAQTQMMLQPWLDEMKQLGINVTMRMQEFPSYHQAYYWTDKARTGNFIMPLTISYASRLIPRENFDKSAKLDETIKAFRELIERGHSFNGYQYSPTLEVGKPVGEDGNAVHPAWRKALSHAIIFLQWDANATKEEQMRIRRAFADQTMKPLREVTKEGGSYANEADRLEPEWQRSFFGANYERLLEVKRRVDPEDVFWAVNSVGSEGWEVRSRDGLPTEDGRLCRVGD